jgi:hypothetical protein
MTTSRKFDTALIYVREPKEDASSAMDGQYLPLTECFGPCSHKFAGLQVGRVRLLFSLPASAQTLVADDIKLPQQLAYVKWFTAFPRAIDANVKVYKLKREVDRDRGPTASIVPISYIHRSVQLFPKWGHQVPDEWTSEKVLDLAPSFYLSSYRDRSMFFRRL